VERLTSFQLYWTDWYQQFLLDVIVVLAITVGSVVLIAFMILRLVLIGVWGVKKIYKGREKED
jgi:flagellar biogenesis protein FliO